MILLVGGEKLVKTRVRYVLLSPETEKAVQGRNHFRFVRMCSEKDQDVILADVCNTTDAARLDVGKEIAKVRAVVPNGILCAAQFYQVGDKLLHLRPDNAVKGMKYRSNAALADVSKHHHVVKHFNASNLLTVVFAYSAMRVAG